MTTCECGDEMEFEWNGIDWILKCQGCQEFRYPTEEEMIAFGNDWAGCRGKGQL